MSRAVLGAPEFKARSGRTVRTLANGDVAFDHANGYLAAVVAMDAEEFFQAKRDADLGWWRWPENPDWVAVEGKRSMHRRTVTLFNERTFEREWLNDKVMEQGSGQDPKHQAARAYFEANRALNPWLEAATGELWVITHPEGTDVCRVVEWRRFKVVAKRTSLSSLPIDHEGITAGHQIGVEVEP